MQFHTTKCLRQALLSNATTISVSTLNAAIKHCSVCIFCFRRGVGKMTETCIYSLAKQMGVVDGQETKMTGLDMLGSSLWLC